MTIFALPSIVSAAQLGSTYTSTLSTSEETLFSGVSLDSVKSVSAMFDAKTMSSADQKVVATPWNITRLKDDSDVTTNMTVQFQASLGDYTKCVIVSLWQDGDDIKGRKTAAKYYSPNKDGSIQIAYSYVEGKDATSSGWVANSYDLSNLAIYDDDDSHLRTELWWNGGTDGAWDDTSANWLDASGAATVWIPGARACFTNSAVATIAIDAGGVSASHLKMQGRRVTFTGGTLSLVCSAEVEMRTGKVRFECPVASSTGFRVLNAMCSYGTLSKSANSSHSKFFSDAVVADVESAIAIPNGSYSSEFNSTAPRAYHAAVSGDGGTVGMQMQWFSGDYTKCVRLELKQSGNDITAMWAKAYYYNTGEKGLDVRGYNFLADPDKHANSSVTYQIKKLRLVARVELAGANTISGLIRADNGATLALVDGGTINGGKCDNIFAIPNAVLEVAHTRQVFTGRIESHEKRSSPKTSGDYPTPSENYPRVHGALAVKGTVDAAKNGTLSYPYNLPDAANPGPTVVFPDADLSGFVAATANFAKSGMTPGEQPWPATPFFFYNDGESVQIQFHRLDNNNAESKWVVYKFTQSGADVVCARTKAAYHGDSVANMTSGFASQYDCFGFDAYYLGGKADRTYFCSNLTVKVENPTDTVVALGGTSSSAQNNFADGVSVDGAVLAVNSPCALPQDATNTTVKAISVANGSKLFVTSRDGDNMLGQSTVNLKDGSKIFFCRPNAHGSTSKIVAENGSEIILECGYPYHGDPNTKFNSALPNIVLKDGSSVRGSGWARVGGEGGLVESARYCVTGTVPCRIEHDLAIQRATNSEDYDYHKFPFYLDVADVTGDAATDLFINGSITNFYRTKHESNIRYGSCREIVKKGAGTVRLGAANSYIGPLTIESGTVLLGADGALNENLTVKFSGGSLDVGGTTTAAGALTLAADASVALGEDGAVSFADSSAANWGENTLSFSGRGRVRFGTSSAGLTPSQLAAVKVNGKSVSINAAGYLVRKGLVIIIN